MSVDGLHLIDGDTVSPAEYRSIRISVGWQSPDLADDRIRQALAATWNVTARDGGGQLLGLARVLDEGLSYASVWDVIVRPDQQRRGIGQALMARVMERTKDRRLVSLVATEAGVALYEAAGFQERDERGRGMFVRQPPPVSPADETP